MNDKSRIRTMEPREKGWFDIDMKVAHFFLGSGTTVSVGVRRVGWASEAMNAYPTTCQYSETRRFHGSEFVPLFAPVAAYTASATQVGSRRHQCEPGSGQDTSPARLVHPEKSRKVVKMSRWTTLRLKVPFPRHDFESHSTRRNQAR